MVKSKLWCDSFVVQLIAWVALITPLGFTQMLGRQASPHSPFVSLFSASLLGHCLCSILRFSTKVPLNDSLPWCPLLMETPSLYGHITPNGPLCHWTWLLSRPRSQSNAYQMVSSCSWMFSAQKSYASRFICYSGHLIFKTDIKDTVFFCSEIVIITLLYAHVEIHTWQNISHIYLLVATTRQLISIQMSEQFKAAAGSHPTSRSSSGNAAS